MTQTPNPNPETRIRLAVDIDRLTRTWVHIEITTDGARHITRHPSLITQLRHAVHHPPPDTEVASAKAIPESRPPCNEEALDQLLHIDHAVRSLVQTAGTRTGTRLEDNLQALTAADDQHLDDVADEIHALRIATEQALGWVPRHLRPRIRCPECNRLGSIAVRIDDHGPHDARCTACGTYWPREHLGILAGVV